MVIKPQMDREVQRLVRETQGRNIEIDFLDYGKVRLSRLGMTFNQIHVRGVTRIEHPYFDPREFDLSIKQIRVGLRIPTAKSFRIVVKILGMDVKGGRLLNEDKEDHERLESVTGLNLQTGLLLEGSPLTWKKQILKRAKQLKEWAFNDQSIENLELKGKAVFIVDDWPVSVRFHTVTNEKGLVHLEGEPQDLRVIAEMIEPKFTDTDLNLAAKNLLKTPKLLSIRTAAEMQAIRLKDRDPEIPYYVPRHIYWSYWLAKAYGADFAREATDAHEIGDNLESEARHEVGREHNALGREYAARNLPEAKIEEMIFSDPRVRLVLQVAEKKSAKAALSKKAAALSSQL